MSRLGAIIPFSQQIAGAGGGSICLPPGGTYYFPPGNFIVAPGLNTQLQWFDPTGQKWRYAALAIFGGSFNYVSSDGSNYRLINIAGTVWNINVTAAGSGATNGIGSTATGVTLALAASPAGALATATAYAIVGGAVAAPTVVQGGSGFVAQPIILVDSPPAGGIQATAVATISAAGVVTAVTMVTAGAGYVSSPNFYVVPQPTGSQATPIGGVAATAVPAPGLVYPTNLPPGSPYEGSKSLAGCQLTSNPLTGSGTLTGGGIINCGWAYTAAPVVTVTGAGAATATSSYVGGTQANDVSYIQQQVS